jgi:hypothetical protein
MGRTMQQRVRQYYDLALVDRAYGDIYRHHREAPAAPAAHG